MLEIQADENEELMKELNRTNPITKSDESLFIKNLENVQGDERDIIIFSVAYAKNQKGRFMNYFGPISQPAGENRLNVAITRARKKIYLVKSIEARLMNVKEDNKGNYFFKKYLQYVELLNRGEDIVTFLNQISDIDYKTEELSQFDSPFEEEVYDVLVDKLPERYDLRNQIRVGSFRIDLAIYDKEKEEFILGIECDGAMYHSSEDAVEHDYYRQQYLESRGWSIYRIWSTNWWEDYQTEVTKVLRFMDLKIS
jgi:very-short-patch-repair endonuclease